MVLSAHSSRTPGFLLAWSISSFWMIFGDLPHLGYVPSKYFYTICSFKTFIIFCIFYPKYLSTQIMNGS